ncbi:MAG: hypothetical protein HYW02_05205 [Deltaproteobacteria bacterium]|nr:hypothetical protein [Deltaproteobacteria bacterium]
MTSVNNYLAMKHVLQVQGMKPKIIFMMQGVNDVSAFLRHGVSFFDVDRYRPLIRNKGYDFIAKNVYSAAFLWRLWKQMDYHGFYARESRKSRSYPVMTEEEFQSLIERMETPLLAALQGVFNRMQILASSNEARLILITEPDSFRSDYHPWRGDDLRAYPLHRGKRCSVEQAGRLMDLYLASRRLCRQRRFHDDSHILGLSAYVTRRGGFDLFPFPCRSILLLDSTSPLRSKRKHEKELLIYDLVSSRALGFP